MAFKKPDFFMAEVATSNRNKNGFGFDSRRRLSESQVRPVQWALEPVHVGGAVHEREQHTVRSGHGAAGDQIQTFSQQEKICHRFVTLLFHLLLLCFILPSVLSAYFVFRALHGRLLRWPRPLVPYSASQQTSLRWFSKRPDSPQLHGFTQESDFSNTALSIEHCLKEIKLTWAFRKCVDMKSNDAFWSIPFVQSETVYWFTINFYCISNDNKKEKMMH